MWHIVPSIGIGHRVDSYLTADNSKDDELVKAIEAGMEFGLKVIIDTAEMYVTVTVKSWW